MLIEANGGMKGHQQPEPADGRDAFGAQSGELRVREGDRMYVAPGDVVAGAYRIERLLGAGKTSFVVAAKNLETGGAFALKFLQERYLRDGAVAHRFAREGQLAAKVACDYVARVHDVGWTGGAPFLAMDLLQGKDLAAVIAESGRLPVEEAVEYAIHACAAIAAGREQGVAQGELQAADLFLVDHLGTKRAKVLDFGLSKVASGGHDAPPRPTRAASLIAAGESRQDTRTVGRLLHDLLTADPSFSVSRGADRDVSNDARRLLPIGQLRAEAPAELCLLVERCVHGDPGGELRNAGELAVALLSFAPLRALAVVEGSPALRRGTLVALPGSRESDEVALAPAEESPSSVHPIPPESTDIELEAAEADEDGTFETLPEADLVEDRPGNARLKFMGATLFLFAIATAAGSWTHPIERRTTAATAALDAPFREAPIVLSQPMLAGGNDLAPASSAASTSPLSAGCGVIPSRGCARLTRVNDGTRGERRPLPP